MIVQVHLYGDLAWKKKLFGTGIQTNDLPARGGFSFLTGISISPIDYFAPIISSQYPGGPRRGYKAALTEPVHPIESMSLTDSRELPEVHLS